MEALLQLKGIDKAFPGVKALSTYRKLKNQSIPLSTPYAT